MAPYFGQTGNGTQTVSAGTVNDTHIFTDGIQNVTGAVAEITMKAINGRTQNVSNGTVKDIQNAKIIFHLWQLIRRETAA
jgi:hypothetical protein